MKSISATLNQLWRRALLLLGLCLLAIQAVDAEDLVAIGQLEAVDVAAATTVSNTSPTNLLTSDEPVVQTGFMGLFADKHESCDSACDGCGNTSARCCCKPWWAHRCGVFAEFLLLRPGSTDFIHAVEQNDTTPAAFPTGPIGIVNIESSAGGRFGFSVCASQCSSLEVIYTGWQGDTSNSITANGSNVLNSTVIHPSSATTGTASLVSSAEYEMDFQALDLSYRRIWRANDCYAINWSGGFRHGNMTQDMIARQDISVATGLVTVDTDVDFEGFGLMMGLDAERRSCRTGMMCYSKALSSFLAGDWTGRYRQSDQIGLGVIANDYNDFRVTPVLELELGIGWRSPCGRCRASIGYMTAAWYNAVSTREYVDAVRASSYVGVDETITFSGLTAGVEANF